MDSQEKYHISRRRFLKASAATAAGLSLAPYVNCGRIGVQQPMVRGFGRIDFEVTTLGLGGQASIQLTPEDVDPVKIILKAFHMGVNYFDTSNRYGPSQLNYGKAFRELHLVPGVPGYDEGLRRSIFLTSKTRLRYGKGGAGRRDAGNTDGPEGSEAVGDLRRTLSQVFGDGQGGYPPGAYVDMVLIHALGNMRDIDTLYTGVADPDPGAERIGALAALRDYRDGTNRTGLNPGEEKLVRHLGFSGHRSPAVMMEMIQRDTEDLLDGMLVSINPNDGLNFSMKRNVMPVAAAKGMGMIAMKVFADGAMYTKEATWSRRPEHVVRTVGSPRIPSRALVEYAVATPGVHTAIIGIGQIDDDPERCQLQQNLSAAQIVPGGFSKKDRLSLEARTREVKDGKTNYFQRPAEPLSPPRDPTAEQTIRNEQRVVRLTWQTAYAGSHPIQHYEIWRDDQKIGRVMYRPQTTKVPFAFEDAVADRGAHHYKLVTVDVGGGTAATEALLVPTTG